MKQFVSCLQLAGYSFTDLDIRKIENEYSFSTFSVFRDFPASRCRLNRPCVTQVSSHGPSVG